MNIAWNEEKNQFLMNTRGISFEIVEELIRDDSVLLEPHPDQEKYPGQIIIIFNYDNYWWVCPAVEFNDGFFLKTIYPSRKVSREMENHE
jgi:uncharacterized DUF497 family protein